MAGQRLQRKISSYSGETIRVNYCVIVNVSSINILIIEKKININSNNYRFSFVCALMTYQLPNDRPLFLLCFVGMQLQVHNYIVCCNYL